MSPHAMDLFDLYRGYGLPLRGRYQVYRSEFHDGGKVGGVSRSLRGACEKMARLYRGTDCICGCYTIRPAIDGKGKA